MHEKEMGQSRRGSRGFTLIELMIVVVVIAILAAIAYPAFNSQIRQGRRADAQQQLLNVALEQEKYRSSNTTYGTCNDLYGGSCPNVSGGSNWGYTVTVTQNTATEYTIQGTPTGDQTADAEGGTSCNPITIDESDNKCPAVCWEVQPGSVTCP